MRFHVMQFHFMRPQNCRQRADLIKCIGIDFLRRKRHDPAAKPSQIWQARMGTHRNTVLPGQTHSFDHGHGISSVKPTGHVGGRDMRHERCVGSHDPIAETLAAINIYVESLSHRDDLRVLKAATSWNSANFRS